MTENNEPDNHRIDIEEGNYNERIEGNYVQGKNNFLNNTFAIFARQGSNEALASAKHSRIQRKLLKQVNLEVESRINSSLHNRVYIVLDAEQNPSQIELPWESEIKVGSKPKVHLTNTQITTVYDQPEIDGRLLILGEPGVGKTTMLLKLAEELVNRAKNDSAHPIPVLFSLFSWKNDSQSVKDWLVDQLKDKYGVRKDIGKQLVDNHEIIPLLDGLDELAAERQEKCVLKINEFLHPSIWIEPVVVCSRVEEYQRYKVLLQLNNSLKLCPFTQEQVYQYLQNTGHLQLWDSISQDEDLKQLAQTPLLLNIIVLSAQEISVQTWQQFKSPEERLSYLFDAYIHRMLKRLYKGKQPKQENTKRWLSWLAHRLMVENTTEFFIEKMQPNWFINSYQKYSYNLIFFTVIGAVITAPIGWLIPRLVPLIFDQMLFVLIRWVPADLMGSLTASMTMKMYYGQMFGLSDWLHIGLMGGCIGGLIRQLIENKIEKIIVLINPFLEISKTTINRLTFGLTFGLIYGLIYGVIYWLVAAGIFGLIFALIFGLIFGLMGEKIQTTETLKFSIEKFLNGLIYGLVIGLIYGATTAQGKGLIGLLIGVLIGALGFGLIFGVIFGLVFGINGREIEKRTFPNQGIKQSVINTIILSTVFSLLATLIILITQRNKDYLSLAILIAIPRSGTPAIKHFILRVILWSTGYIPWNYAKFLDYCTNRVFLQRVGGSYRFMHDLLRQHFAKSYTQTSLAPVQAIPVETSPTVQNHIVCTNTNCGHNNPVSSNFCINCGTPLTKPHI